MMINNHGYKMIDFNSRVPVLKGWSGDKKYCVTDKEGSKYLLRVSPEDQYEKRKALFHVLKKVEALGIPMCRPVDFELGGDGVYSLHTWINGEDAEDVIPRLPDVQQYILGFQSGEILKNIHSIPAPEDQEDWYQRFRRKTETKIRRYRECGLRFEGDEDVIRYLENNWALLKNRPQCFQHGDYHIGNMMLENGKLVIIDFDRFDYGDPWEEFNRIVWCAQKSPLFATGQLNGYFGGEVPMDFWKLLAFYIGSNTLSSIYWAMDFGQSDIDTMMGQAREVLQWYDGMRNPVPVWYNASNGSFEAIDKSLCRFSSSKLNGIVDNFYYQVTDGIPYKLKEPFDFSFLKEYGKVFKVFDDQDSGNICFGTERDGRRYFVKFAGAPTARGSVTPEEAVENLKKTVPVYRDLKHKNLINLLTAGERAGGYAMVFEWAEGCCMGRQYPISHKKFMSLPVEARLKAFGDVLEFHSFAAEKGYVAIDFYEGSVMYDAEREKTTVCDIDFYTKMPYVNPMGRMWGSSGFMSPEEFELGAVIDEVTNVYNMGAAAFAFFADRRRDRERWPLTEALYRVAEKAVRAERSQRQQSINRFIFEWNQALKTNGK